MTFSIDNPERGLQQPAFGKYVWKKRSGELGVKLRRFKGEKQSRG